MAAVAPPPDQTSELLQNLSLNSQEMTIEVPDATKKPSIDPNHLPNWIPADQSLAPILSEFMDPAMCCLPSGYPSTAYYFSGYDGSFNDWENYARSINQGGVEMTPGVYAENGSLEYHSYGYTPYGLYSPAVSSVPTMGHDGQIYGAQHYQYPIYGAQHYQYPTPYFQSLIPSSGQLPTPVTPAKGGIATSAGAEIPKSNGPANNAGAKGNTGTAPARATYLNSSHSMNGSYARGGLPGVVPASGYQDPSFVFNGLQFPVPWLESVYFSDGQPRNVLSTSKPTSIANGNGVPTSRNQNCCSYMMGQHHPRSMSGMNSASEYIDRIYQNKLYNQNGHAYSFSRGYGTNSHDTRWNGRGWKAVDSKYKPSGRGNGFYDSLNKSIDGLNEVNRGPRAINSKNLKGLKAVALAVEGRNIPLTGTNVSEKLSSGILDQEQYNRPDFPETYVDAKFFIIKSYSEDDVHKSVKYNLWASTPNGNEKLNAAYLDAQQRSEGCPVFLFFSVNTSGQFVGVAEMMGPVDFHKKVEYWQQDRWIGCFPVKWHIIKDVPNSSLKHITLENNENKPVTTSRDTQEVKHDQGLKLFKIFKEYTSKHCILDDFDFYEDRQKRIQENKAKYQQFQKLVWEGKPAEEKTKDDNTNGRVRPQKLLGSETDLDKEASKVHSDGDIKITSVDGCFVPQLEDAFKSAGPAGGAVPDKKHVDGVANGC